MCAGSLWSCPTLCDPVDCGLPGFCVRMVGFFRQEYWSILANTGCHTLLEHYISCCSSLQLPWVPGAARTPVTQAAAPPPHLAFTEANPSPPGQPQGQTPVDDPHAEVEIKPPLKPRAVWLRKKPQNLLTSCTNCRLNPHDQLGRLCLWNIWKVIESSHKRKHTSSECHGHWRQKHPRSRTRLESELPPQQV